MNQLQEKALQWYYHLTNRKPSNLNLEITWRCNLKCGLCPSRAGHGQKGELKQKDMAFDDIKRIIKKLPQLRTVNFIGAGEPMLHPDFYEILNYLHKMRLGITFTTNGTLITEQNVEKLTPNVDRVVVSVDSPNPNKYNEMRPGADYIQVCRNIHTLKKLKKDIQINIQMLVTKDTVASLEAMVLFADAYDATLQLLHPIAFDKQMDQQHIHQGMDARLYEQFINDMKQRAKRERVNLYPRETYPNQHFCIAPWKSIMVAINGDLYPCCYIYEGRGDDWTYPEYYDGFKIDVPMEYYKLGNILNGTRDEKREGIIKNQLLRMKKTDVPLETLRRYYDIVYSPIGMNERYCDICLYRWGCAC